MEHKNINHKKINIKHKNHQNLLNILRDKRLHYLIKPYKKLIYQIQGNSQSKIFKSIKKTRSKEFIQDILISYFDKKNISYEIKEQKTYEDKTANERIKKYRNKVSKTKKLISFYVDVEFYEFLQIYKSEHPKETYESILKSRFEL